MIIDYFPFFNECELLELRIRLLEPHVDHFVICEADRTFTGIAKPLIVPNLIQELGLPQDRITVVQLQVPADLDLPLEEHDITSQYPEDRADLVSIKAYARDRAQLLEGEAAAVRSHAHHEVLVLELLRLERGGAAAVDPGLALRLEQWRAQQSGSVAERPA